MQHEKSRKIIALMIITIVLTSGILSGCGSQEQETGNDQLYSFIIPESLMGGQDAGDVVETFNDPNATVLSASGDEIPIIEVFTDIKENEDGSVTYVFTGEQLEEYQQIVYDIATLKTYINLGYIESVKKTEVSNDTDIKIYVDDEIYNSGTESWYVVLYATNYLGLYQILSGVDPDEWKVNITVVDNESGDIILDESFPNDWWLNSLVVDVAFHPETKEEYVVYRRLYGDGSLWNRPKDMFLSEVNHEKYPDVKQKYRFELLDIGSVVK